MKQIWWALGVWISLLPALGLGNSPVSELFQTGDLIFQVSQSAQSAALEEATESQWTHMGVVVSGKSGLQVFEAVQPVKSTPLREWVARGKNRTFVVKRVESKYVDMSRPQLQHELVAELKSYMGLGYDIFFEWSDDRIYCSELAFKGYATALGLQIGTLQKMGDLRLGGPKVKKLIFDRLTSAGKELNLEEPVITPVSMFNSPVLKTIIDSRKSKVPLL